MMNMPKIIARGYSNFISHYDSAKEMLSKWRIINYMKSKNKKYRAAEDLLHDDVLCAQIMELLEKWRAK